MRFATIGAYGLTLRGEFGIDVSADRERRRMLAITADHQAMTRIGWVQSSGWFGGSRIATAVVVVAVDGRRQKTGERIGRFERTDTAVTFQTAADGRRSDTDAVLTQPERLVHGQRRLLLLLLHRLLLLLLLLFQFVGPLLLAVFVIQRRPRSDNRSHFGFLFLGTRGVGGEGNKVTRYLSKGRAGWVGDIGFV